MSKKSSSPYQKFGKRPHRYSEEYVNWKRCALKGDKEGQAHWARKHTVKFGRPSWGRAEQQDYLPPMQEQRRAA